MWHPAPAPFERQEGETIMTDCKIKMTDKLLPVEGSVLPDGTGTCPKCDTPGVMLSIVGGFIRKHVVAATAVPENNPQPATLVEPPVKHGKGLSEPQTDLTDTGLRTGDPRAAEQRRVAEIEGAAGIGTVQVPRKVKGTGTTKSGDPRMTTKMVDVPSSEETVREALEYWRKKRITKKTSDASRVKQQEMISLLARRLESIMAVQEVRYNSATRKLDVVATVPVAEQSELSATPDSAAAHRGPTLVPGRDVTPRQRPVDLPWSESTDKLRNGETRKRTTLDEPRGRDRFDRKITDVPAPERKRTAAERRRFRRQQQQQRHNGQ